MNAQSLGALLGTASICWACAADPDIRPLPAQAERHLSPEDSAYQDGKDHLRAGRYGLAIVYFEKALAADPSSVSALNAIGTAYDQLHKYALAQSFYKTALTLDPQNADTWNNMAVSLRLAGATDAARKFLEQAMKLDPANQTINANMVELNGGESDQKPVVAEASSGSLAAEPDGDVVRPLLRRSGLREYELALPDALRVPRSDERQGVTVSPILIEQGRAAIVPITAEYLQAVPVAKVTAIPLPPPEIEVAVAIDMPPPVAIQSSQPQIELSNGVGRRHMAARLRTYLDAHGIAIAKIDDARPFDRIATVVAYRPGWANQARALAQALPLAVSVEPDAAIVAPIRVVLGRDLSAFDRQLEASHADEH
jgi:hypothetical protein